MALALTIAYSAHANEECELTKRHINAWRSNTVCDGAYLGKQLGLSGEKNFAEALKSSGGFDGVTNAQLGGSGDSTFNRVVEVRSKLGDTSKSAYEWITADDGILKKLGGAGETVIVNVDSVYADVVATDIARGATNISKGVTDTKNLLGGSGTLLDRATTARNAVGATNIFADAGTVNTLLGGGSTAVANATTVRNALGDSSASAYGHIKTAVTGIEALIGDTSSGSLGGDPAHPIKTELATLKTFVGGIAI